MHFYHRTFIIFEFEDHPVYANIFFFRKRKCKTREVDNVWDTQVGQQNQVFLMLVEKSSFYSHYCTSISRTSYERVAPQLGGDSLHNPSLRKILIFVYVM